MLMEKLVEKAQHAGRYTRWFWAGLITVLGLILALVAVRHKTALDKARSDIADAEYKKEREQINAAISKTEKEIKRRNNKIDHLDQKIALSKERVVKVEKAHSTRVEQIKKAKTWKDLESV